MKASLLEQVGCFACRVGLACTVGDILRPRVELNTPIHSVISIKEALFWKDVGRSPYTGSFFRGPPLLLSLFQLTSERFVWQVSFLSLVDWITARVLSKVVTHTERQSRINDTGKVGCRLANGVLYIINCHPKLCLQSTHMCGSQHRSCT